MVDFPFTANLPPIILEQIIAKLDWKNYFRLQQTCRQMEEFVRTNGKLYTRMDKNANFKWIRYERGESRLLLNFSSGTVKIIEVYGIRLRLLGAPRHMEMAYPEFCEILKRHRITTVRLSLKPSLGFELSKEYCKELIEILKPVEMQIESHDSNRFEALIYSRNLKRLKVFGLDPFKVCPFMEEFMRHRDVQLTAFCQEGYSPEEIVTILSSVCQFLCCVATFNMTLQAFELNLIWNPDSRKEILETVQDSMSSLIKTIHGEACGTRCHIEMPGQSRCSIIVDRNSSAVIFQY